MLIKRVLYIFWIFMSLLIMGMLSWYMSKENLTLLQLIQMRPITTIVFLFCFIFLSYACCLYAIDRTLQYEQYLKSFLVVAMIQQLCMFNFVGALLCFLYVRKLKQQSLHIKSLFFSTSWIGVMLIAISFIIVLLVFVRMVGV